MRNMEQVTRYVICSVMPCIFPFICFKLHMLIFGPKKKEEAAYAYLLLFCISYGMLKGFDVHTPDEDSPP